MATPHGKSLIAGKRSPRSGKTFQAFSPVELNSLPGDFLPAELDEVDEAMKAAREAFPSFRATSGETRAAFLEAIAGNLISLGAGLIRRAQLETGLSENRLRGELDRTTGHLKMFAAIARDGSWQDLRHEPALPERQPTPRPDLKRIFQPIGPVAVFGSSNFPFAYSVAGGDTASALATGNPVVVKAHEAHPGTSELVAGAILSAAESMSLAPGVFSLLQGPGKLLAVPLVTHPDCRAVGFTGSTNVGRILIDAAARRPDPIPVFAEMGSLNPVVILPSALEDQSDEIADLLIRSITTDAGQFCTKPGVVLVPRTQRTEHFINQLSLKLAAVSPVPMLHRGIHEDFQKGAAKLRSLSSVALIAHKPADPGTLQGEPQLFLTDYGSFLSGDDFRREYFGPLSIFVTYPDSDSIRPVLRSISGQLTASVFSEPTDPALDPLLPLLGEIAGRVIFNGVPTGVEVNSAIQHGGPWPACSDSRFSAVGPDALRRFIRPIAYQNFDPGLFQRTVG
jgi:alpha-ketoglutaric semialdehyde dehydrogenase